jgi:hypothetical protein
MTLDKLTQLRGDATAVRPLFAEILARARASLPEENTGIKLTDHLEIHFIELLKFRKLLMKNANGIRR